EYVGQQVAVGVHLEAVPGGVADHDIARAGIDGGPIRRQVHGAQRRLVHGGHTLVDAVAVVVARPERAEPGVAAGRSPDGPSVADKRFRAGQGRVGMVQRRPAIPVLHAANEGSAEGAHQLRIFAEALVGAPPAYILRDGDTGGEVPVDIRGDKLAGDDTADGFDESGVAGRRKADVGRKNRRAVDVIVAVYRVYAVDERDSQP